MKTRLATAALTIMFLSAGAFAGGQHGMPLHQPAMVEHVTVISKNSQLPARIKAMPAACSQSRCIDV
jgi:hypothetical protein